MPSQFEQLTNTIARLRAEDGCPWDREQTHRSLARYLLEETYEVLEAIHLDDSEKLKEELGDLLLQIVLNSQIAKEAGQFDIEDVARTINEKMIRRHPHVFGDDKLETAQQVLSQWDELKAKEKKPDKGSTNGSLLGEVPRTMPALLQALKISEKAVYQGFEWPDEESLWQCLDSELQELREAIVNFRGKVGKDGQKNINDPKLVPFLVELNLEMGDVLFSLVNLARWHSLNPEESLLMAIDKFKKRFQHMEKFANRPLKELSFEEWTELWQKAKTAGIAIQD
jgi:tetrapyrrole methylase family protein / MazG family protein